MEMINGRHSIYINRSYILRNRSGNDKRKVLNIYINRSYILRNRSGNDKWKVNIYIKESQWK